MTFLEFLDRWMDRRARARHRPRDIRQFIGFAFLAGYYVMVWQFASRSVPAENLDLIRDAMLTLGPPVGLIVGAMFRADARDDQAAVNTGRAFSAIEAAARAGGSDPAAIRAGDQVELRRSDEA